MPAEFVLNPDLRPDGLARAFATTGRVEIADFLAPGGAERLRADLLARADWTLVLNAGDNVYEIPRAGFAAMSDGQRAELDRRVVEAGRHGFQYRYDSIRVPDDPAGRAGRDTALDAFVAFMGAPATLAFLAAVTGARDLAFADGQATAYAPGHFLTRHDDDVAGKGRRAAYVFGLAPGWRAEWGGLLMFHGADGQIDGGYVPAMGALRLFAVPALHSVSYVAPLAPEPRLSVTGWLRTASPSA